MKKKIDNTTEKKLAKDRNGHFQKGNRAGDKHMGNAN